MTLRTLAILTLALTTTSCSIFSGFGSKPIEVISTPIEIEIMQPVLPRPLDLTAPNWFVVSEAAVDNLCVRTLSYDPKKFEEKDGIKIEKLKRPKNCALADRDNPEWPVGYSHLDLFMDEMKERNGGEIVFVATTIGDYEVMSGNMQEIKRYIKQLGEVVVYYREVTIKKPTGDEKGAGVAIKTND